ncbi:MAG: 16S rRNA (guanine(527)-N(7))-methyltransferase RsmG [Clostridia bacterium]|nr:16S rRNA (guanine(527)-N(7))-methyltransferase RsmG [Clostridia bacterium]
MEIIKKYFADLSVRQTEQLGQLQELYTFWNERVNVISRRDIENLYERHVLHSLAIAKVISFADGTEVIDAGTGGGFPGIPLAILFPEVRFHLIDSIAKKIKVVQAVAESLSLANVTAAAVRLEEIKETADFVVSRAVTQLPQFAQWAMPRINAGANNSLANGILYLKGGDLTAELLQIKLHSRVVPLGRYFDEEFFETKALVHLWKPAGAKENFKKSKPNEKT